MPTPPADALTRAHAEWHAANDELRRQEKLLSDALALYTAGDAPCPLDLMRDVRLMRRDCNKRFKALMAAMGMSSDSQDSV